MAKKLIMACVMVVALTAFALPPSAFASKMTATHPTGTVAPVGTKIIGTNTNTNVQGTNEDVVMRLTDLFNETLVACTKMSMTGTLVKNDHEALEGTIEKAEFKGTPGVTPHTSHCESSFGTVTVTTNPATNGLNWCLRSTAAMAEDEVQIRGGSCIQGARAIRFILHSSIAGECTYERAVTSPVKGTITTHPQDPIVHIERQEFGRIAGGIFCPSRGLLDLTVELFAETWANEESGFLWIDKAT